MVRILLQDVKGFFQKVIVGSGAPSLRGLLQFGMDVSYSSLKKYSLGLRVLPEELFLQLCVIGEIDSGSVSFERVQDSWGQQKGGRKSRRGKHDPAKN